MASSSTAAPTTADTSPGLNKRKASALVEFQGVKSFERLFHREFELVFSCPVILWEAESPRGAWLIARLLGAGGRGEGNEVWMLWSAKEKEVGKEGKE